LIFAVMSEESYDIKRNWFKKLIEYLRKKVKVVVISKETYEEKKSFDLSVIMLFVYSLFAFLILIVLSYFIISATSLKYMIPGFPKIVDVERIKQIDKKNLLKLAEYEDKIDHYENYFNNLSIILNGGEISEEVNKADSSIGNRNNEEYNFDLTENDSLLRIKIDDREKYDISIFSSNNRLEEKLNGVLFFSPLKGEVTNQFHLEKGHYGVDVIASNNEAVKAILNGTVVYSDWSPENGHVIHIQHAQNLVSIYKHNSFLLKKTGDLIKAGDAIAIVGNSGELSTGPHLHFELWHNGIPLDPEKFVVFD